MNIDKALRLQNVSVLFDLARDTYKQHFGMLIKINFVPALVGILVASVFSMMSDFESLSIYLTKLDFLAISAFMFGVTCVSGIVSSLNYISQIIFLGHADAMAQTGLAENGSEVSIEDKKTISIFTVYDKASKLLFSYFALMILAGLIVSLGFLLLIVPGVVCSVWFVFASCILILKKEKGIQALRKSKYYVRGIWTEVCIRLIVAGLLSLLLNIALSVLKNLFAEVGTGLFPIEYINMILDFLYTLIISPYFIVYIYELFKDVVNANEGNVDESENVEV